MFVGTGQGRACELESGLQPRRKASITWTTLPTRWVDMSSMADFILSKGSSGRPKRMMLLEWSKERKGRAESGVGRRQSSWIRNVRNLTYLFSNKRKWSNRRRKFAKLLKITNNFVKGRARLVNDIRWRGCQGGKMLNFISQGVQCIGLGIRIHWNSEGLDMGAW